MKIINNRDDPKNHHRRSIRLKGYDYAQAGAYFVTMVTQGRQSLFGLIENGVMKNNEAGKMVEKWWFELPHKFPTLELGVMVIMPNHFHGIIMIKGADLRVCPDETKRSPRDTGAFSHEELRCKGAHTGAPQLGQLNESDTTGAHHRISFSVIVQWYKTMTTNEYIRSVENSGWTPFAGKLWQRDYFEHIIRDEKEMKKIWNYIESNSAMWAEDKENPDNEADLKG